MYMRIKFILFLVLPTLLLMTIAPCTYAQDLASTEPIVQVNITTSGGSGQIIENAGMPNETLRKYGITGNYASGTKFVLTASETGCEFLYWQDVDSRRIITRDKTCVITAGTNTTINAVFRPTTPNKLVTFQNSNGHVISLTYAADSKTIDVPSTPSVHGYVFDSWTLNGIAQTFNNNTINVSELSGDSIYIASYTPKTTLYDVNVSGGTGSGKYIYNTKVVVNLDESLIPQGKVFAYWSNGKNILSYDKTYSFHVGTNTNISAVYEDVQPIQKQPTLSIVVADINTSTNKIAFLAERSLPLDYEFVETGILVHTGKNFDLSTGGVAKVKAISQKPSGQFSITKHSVSAGSVWYARAYMIYLKDGVSNIIYSDVVNATLN